MIFEHHSYRGYLKSVLAARTTRNPQYSLRAFASQLGVGHSTICEILKGKKNFSNESAYRVAKQLALGKRESQYFALLVQLESSKDPEYRAEVLKRLRSLAPRNKPRDLSVDAFQVLAEWYHLPVLQYAQLDNNLFNSSTAAAALGITRIEAEAAIERLERLELLQRDAQGVLRRVPDTVRVESPAPNLGLRRFHKQMLEKAIVALEEQTNQEKVVGSETVAFDPEQLESVRRLTDQYLDAVAALASKSTQRTRVYHLGVQFFNLTRKSPEAAVKEPV